MTSDDRAKGAKEAVADEVKALAGKIYDDAAKPALAQVGDTVGLAVKVALKPVNLILSRINAAMDQFSAAIESKLGRVPADRRLPAPPSTIGAPAALHYALLGEGDEVAELRGMFVDLLVSSMDRDTCASAHPAFVSMIAQLTPDEAWILKSIDRHDYALCTLREYADTSRSLGFRTTLGFGTGIDESRRLEYISNLVRLGILHISGSLASNLEEYGPLKEAVEAEFADRDHNLHLDRGSIEVTPFGRKFLDICVRVHSAVAAPG